MTKVRIRHKRPSATLSHVGFAQLAQMSLEQVQALSQSVIDQALAEAPQPDQTQRWADPDAKPSLTLDDVKGMNEDQLTANWDLVKLILQKAYIQQKETDYD